MDDLAHGDTFELWGAFEGAKTAGVIIERFPSLAFEGKPIEAGEVYVVGVLPEFRGRGVATAPVEHALCDF
jgi:ribosomal protein S18 acetylase RimI-like enzyme